jgi:hypothetical protein
MSIKHAHTTCIYYMYKQHHIQIRYTRARSLLFESEVYKKSIVEVDMHKTINFTCVPLLSDESEQ